MKREMQFEQLLEAFVNHPDRAMGMIQDILNENMETVEGILDDILIMEYKNQTEHGQLINHVEALEGIRKKLKGLIETAIPFPKMLQSEIHSVESNALIQGILWAASMNRYMPSVMYSDYIKYLAKVIGAPKLNEKEIKCLVNQLSIEKVSTDLYNSHLRTEASRRSGWFKADQKTSGRIVPLHLTVYQMSYFEIINILRGIQKRNGKEYLQFRVRLKEWGKERIREILRHEMWDDLKKYIHQKYPENNIEKKDDAESFIDEFIFDMELVQKQYHSFILSGKLNKRNEKIGSGCNHNFHFYLCLLYNYVRRYTHPQYKYLALYCLEQIYCGNTLSGILHGYDGYAIFREYILKIGERYFLEAQKQCKDTDKYMLLVQKQERVLINGREQLEKEAKQLWKADHYWKKRFYYIQKVYGLFGQCLFRQMAECLRKRNKSTRDMQIYLHGILTYLNSFLECESNRKWGMILTEYRGLSILIDFDLWFLFRPFIVTVNRQKSAEEFFKPLNSSEKWICFMYDWKGGSNQEIIEEILKYLEQNHLCDCQELIKSIIYQMYRSKNVDGTLNKIFDRYVDELSEELLNDKSIDISTWVKERNERWNIKVPSCVVLIQNIFYDFYNDCDDFDSMQARQKLMQKYGLSFRMPLWKDLDIQNRLQKIIQNYNGDRRWPKLYFWYLKNADWISREAVRMVESYKK